MTTAEQIKQRFRDQGETVSSWARKHGFRPHAVYRVLNGYDNGNYGTAHKIAQALGLKAVVSPPVEFTAKRPKTTSEQKRSAA